MSIITKRGDSGETDMLYGRRVPKNDARMEAIGTVDELSAALGVVRALDDRPGIDALIASLQEQLIGLMGELAVAPEDAGQYAEQGFPAITAEGVSAIEESARQLEAGIPPARDWIRPGAAGNQAAAHLDLARCICRRAERRVLELGEGVPNKNVAVFLNRASDLLWLMARAVERGQGPLSDRSQPTANPPAPAG